MNRLYERALRIAYGNFETTLDEHLTKDDSVTVHQRNLRAWVLKFIKSQISLSIFHVESFYRIKCISKTRSYVYINIKNDLI